MKSQQDLGTEYKDDVPRIYVKWVVFIFSCVMSTFFGGILYSQNLHETSQKKEIAKVLIGCVLWHLLSKSLLVNAASITNPLLLLFVPNIIGGTALTQLWNYHFAKITPFQKRKIWFPLIVFIVVYGTLILLNIYD